MDGHRRLAVSRAAEEAAGEFLARRGMVLVDADVRMPGGQIDLVMLDAGCLVVVEVKARRGAAFGTPEEAVDRRKLDRLRRLASTYRQVHPRVGRGIRVDVVAVDLAADGRPSGFRHVRDVLA